MRSDQSNLFEILGLETQPTKYDSIPEEFWKLIDTIKREKRWDDKELEYWMPKIKNLCGVPKLWKDTFVHPEDTLLTAIKNKDFTDKTVARLVSNANHALTFLEKKEQEDFLGWLHENRRKDSWDFRKIIRYRRKLCALREDYKNMWLLGDWRNHIELLRGGSGRLLLIDPPYGMEYQSDRRTDRRKERKHSKIKNDGLEDALGEIKEALTAVDSKLASNAHVLCFCHWRYEPLVSEVIRSCGYTIRGSLIWCKNNAGMGDPFTTFAPQHERIIHAVKGSPILFSRKSDIFQADKIGTANHPTEKPVRLLQELIECTTAENELIIDMFGGVASTHVAAKISNRRYWGTELIEEFYKIGKKRLENCTNQTTLF